jgi:Domain of unknown function (DUF4328)/Protein of unknown function (DUF2510)
VYSYAAPRPWRDNRRFVSIACSVWIASIVIAGAGELRSASDVADVLVNDPQGSYTFGFGLGLNPTVGSGVTTLFGAVNLVGVVVVIVATRRLAMAHAALGRPATTWGPGWAVAGRLIPLASAVIPAIQLDELWRGSHPANLPDDRAWRDRPRSPAALGVLISGVAGTAIGIVTAISLGVALFRAIIDFGEDDSDQRFADAVADARPWRIAAMAALLTAALLATWMLVRIAARQQLLHERYPDATAGATGPAAAHPWQATFPPGWFADPWARYPLRWWDGTQWSPHVSADGLANYDPVPSE